MNMAKLERVQRAQSDVERQIQDSQTRIALITAERDEAQKKLHFEIGNSSRLECDLDHTRNQLTHFSNEQVSL